MKLSMSAARLGCCLGIFLALMILGWTQSAVAQTPGAGKARLAIVVAADDLGSELAAKENAARTSVASRLEKLGYQFLGLDGQGACTVATTATAVPSRALPKALACAGDATRGAELVVFYYAGRVSGGADDVGLVIEKGQAPISVRSLLQEEASRQDFTSVVAVEALEFSEAQPSAPPMEARGLRRILLLPLPAANDKGAAPGTFTERLAAEMDIEIEAQGKGGELRDLRTLVTAPNLLSGEGNSGLSHRVIIEGVDSHDVTLAGSVRPEVPAATAQQDCSAVPRLVAAGAACARVASFAKSCTGGTYASFVDSIQQLRCNEDFVERKREVLRGEFAEAGKASTCAALEAFVRKFGEDYDLADAPDMDKGVRLRNTLCEEERRQKEIAQLESGLRPLLETPDCDSLGVFQRSNGAKLTDDQLNRLLAAQKPRCELEAAAKAELTSCLSAVEARGDYCGGTKCLDAFGQKLPGERNLKTFSSEPRRHANICKESASMQSCFNSDPCGGSRCSYALRLAVAQGPLISHIETLERDAARRCEVIRERERQERAREAAERREREIFELTLCNNASVGKIWVAVHYYHYDDNEWVVEGWWTVDESDCHTLSLPMRRGTIHVFANSSGHRYVWRGDPNDDDDKKLCVSMSAFKRSTERSTTCGASNLKVFREVTVNSSSHTYNFND